MATMVSGSPLARRCAVCSNGRSKCVNRGGALHATGGDRVVGTDAAGVAGLVGGTTTGGVAVGVAAASTRIAAGATIGAGAGTSACAAAKPARTADAAATRARRAIIIWLLGDINASFAFSRRPDVLHR
jgi:hypothetical protein